MDSASGADPATRSPSAAATTAPAPTIPAAGDRCTAAAFGSSPKVKWGHTSRFPNQEIRVAQRPAELKMRPGHRLQSLGNVTRTNDVPILRAVAERLGGVPLLGVQLGPGLARSGGGVFIVTIPGSLGPTQDLKSLPFGVGQVIPILGFPIANVPQLANSVSGWRRERAQWTCESRSRFALVLPVGDGRGPCG